MSNAVSAYAQNIPSDDCDEITRFGVYRVGPNTQNAYQGNMGGIVLALPWDANRQQQISASPDGTTMAYRRKSNGVWGAWTPISTATPPQEFDLVLYDGFTVNGSCFYYKTQESVVHVIGGVNGSFPYKLSTVIGQLPAGFRPSAAIRGIAVTNNAPAYIQVNTNGAVVLYEMGLDGTPTGASAFFALSFVAGS